MEALEMENLNLQRRLTDSLKQLSPAALNAHAPDFIPPQTISSSFNTDSKILPGMKGKYIFNPIRYWSAIRKPQLKEIILAQ